MMVDPKRQRELDEALATIRDVLPRTWRQLYEGCLAAGFGPSEAMDLVKTYILSQNQRGIVPPSYGTEEGGDDYGNP